MDPAVAFFAIFVAFVVGLTAGYYVALFQYAGSAVLTRLLADCNCDDCAKARHV